MTGPASRRLHPRRGLLTSLLAAAAVTAALAPAGPPAAAAVTGPVPMAHKAGPFVVRRVRVGLGPAGIAVDTRNGTVWVASTGSGTVTEFRESTGRILATLTVGGRPDAVAVDSRRGLVWVTNYALAGQVWEISAARHRVIRVLNAGEFPDQVIVDEAGGGIWIGSVQVADNALGTDTLWHLARPSASAAARQLAGPTPATDSVQGLGLNSAGTRLNVIWCSECINNYYAPTNSWYLRQLSATTGRKLAARQFRPGQEQPAVTTVVSGAPGGLWAVIFTNPAEAYRLAQFSSAGAVTRSVALPMAQADYYFDPVYDPRTGTVWMLAQNTKNAGLQYLVSTALHPGATASVLPLKTLLAATALDPATGRIFVCEYQASRVAVIQGPAPAAVTTPAAVRAIHAHPARIALVSGQPR
jgi:hypothetical protein